MDINEYKASYAKVQEVYDKNIAKLNRGYALSNSRYRVGDKVTANGRTIIIDSVGYSTALSEAGELPAITYKGAEAGGGKRYAIYESSLKS